MFSKEIQLGGTTDVKEIKGIAEQQFFLLIRERLPDAQITYEETEFAIQNGNGNPTSTVPDFSIIKNGRRTVVEITTSNTNGEHPKVRQIEIMKYFPEVRFVVLTRENLEAIHKKHPKIDFFNSKRIK